MSCRLSTSSSATQQPLWAKVCLGFYVLCIITSLDTRTVDGFSAVVPQTGRKTISCQSAEAPISSSKTQIAQSSIAHEINEYYDEAPSSLASAPSSYSSQASYSSSSSSQASVAAKAAAKKAAKAIKNKKAQESAAQTQQYQGAMILSAYLSNPDLTPFEAWSVVNMELKYQEALSLKCPFMRRRATDMLDTADMMLRFFVIRHKSLGMLAPPPSWRCSENCLVCQKQKHLSFVETAEIIRRDWRPENNKGYYITGKLSSTIYRDDCLFDGPDPDMPVKGLRKYLNAASQLFDQGKSRSQLLSLDIVSKKDLLPGKYKDNSEIMEGRYNEDDQVIVAKWRMHGILRLPWKPVLPAWTGETRYHRDRDGLIYLHEETWDMSVAQAFLRTFWPALARQIWCSTADATGSSVPNNQNVPEDVCMMDYDEDDDDEDDDGHY